MQLHLACPAQLARQGTHVIHLENAFTADLNEQQQMKLSDALNSGVSHWLTPMQERCMTRVATRDLKVREHREAMIGSIQLQSKMLTEQ